MNFVCVCLLVKMSLEIRSPGKKVVYFYSALLDLDYG